jgi:hypothetical protein
MVGGHCERPEIDVKTLRDLLGCNATRFGAWRCVECRKCDEEGDKVRYVVSCYHGVEGQGFGKLGDRG